MRFVQLVHTIIVVTFLISNATATNIESKDVVREDCPDLCTCGYSESILRLQLNCSSLGLVDVPRVQFTVSFDIYLNDNNLTLLENETFDDYALVAHLVLKHNAITYIEKGAFEKIYPSFLDLSDNHITTIELVYMFVMQLNLNGNPIHMHDGVPGPNTQIIITASLEDCELTHLSRSFFVSMTNLTYLYMSNNFIENIDGIFQDLVKLFMLYLGNNSISKVEGSGAFVGLNHIFYIGLERNPLQVLDIESLEVLPNLGRLDISNTPLVCECLHEKLYWWARQQNVYLLDDCESADTKCRFSPFSTTTPTTTTEQWCGDVPACGDEFCCPQGACSKNGKCDGAALVALPGVILLLMAYVTAVFRYPL